MATRIGAGWENTEFAGLVYTLPSNIHLTEVSWNSDYYSGGRNITYRFISTGHIPTELFNLISRWTLQAARGYSRCEIADYSIQSAPGHTSYEYLDISLTLSLIPSFGFDSEPHRVVRAHKSENAKTLLLSELDNEQRQEYERYGYFHVKFGPIKRFKITTSSIYNVIDKFRRKRYCLTTRYENVPIEDLMLIEKILLERNPKRFFETANEEKL